MDYEINDQEADEYGPGSDLMLSMFAIAMLILCLISIDGRRRVQLLTAQLDEVKRASPSVKTDPKTLEEIILLTSALQVEKLENEKLRQEINYVNGERNSASDGLAKLEDQVKTDKSKTEITIITLEQLIVDLRDKITKLEYSRRAFPDATLVVLQEGGRSNAFEKNSALLNSGGKEAVVKSLAVQRSKLALDQLNTLLVEGFASPEPSRNKLPSRQRQDLPQAIEYGILECFDSDQTGVGKEIGGKDCRMNYSLDRNLELSFQRAKEVWTFLVARGVPRWCVAILAHGRNRSELLHTNATTEADIKSWDDQWFATSGTSGRAAIAENLLSRERRVEIRAINDPLSKCSPLDLANALAALH